MFDRLLIAAIFMFLFAPSYAQTPHASVSGDAYDFGSVKQGTHISHTFTVKNTGDGPLRFTGASLSLPGMNVRMAPAISPGTEGTVTLEWTTAQIAGAVEGVAQIKTNDPEHPEFTLTLKGRVTPPISIEPIPSVFLSAFSNEPAERVLTIRNNDERPLAIARVESKGHVAATVATLETGRVITVTVRPVANIPPGRYDESLTLVTDHPDRERITLPVHLWIKPDLYANPDVVDFGTVSRQELQSAANANAQTVLIKRRNGKFKIRSIASDSPAVKVTASPVGTSETFRLDVRLESKAELGRSIDTSIRIKTDDPKFSTLVIPVKATLIESSPKPQ